MSDPIKHECGLAFIRLRKPLSYYMEKYGTVMYGLNKLYLLMEKQHNRGQDGAGVASVKLNAPVESRFITRMRSNSSQPIADIFSKIAEGIKELELHQPDIQKHPEFIKGNLPILGEILLGHLRYGTQGQNNLEFCHPYIKRSMEKSKNLALAGNFNLVNTEELFNAVGLTMGEFQKQSDLAAMMEVILHYLVKESDASNGNPDIEKVLKQAAIKFDGGFTVGGLVGNGSSFVLRDANGIRPAYYYIDDEIIVCASERASIRTTFNIGPDIVKPLPPGHALIVKPDGSYIVSRILPEKEKRACSFERIYFSRGGDEKIYRERIALGHHLSEKVLKAIDYDLKNTIFSYIPNTAEVAYFGLIKGMEEYLNKIKVERIMSWNKDFDEEKLSQMVNRTIRQEKIAIKDVKMRTFITADKGRNEMVQHVYDITYGTVKDNEDTIVVIDDSIVRGTTLKESIVRMLARLNPKKIIIVSSAPQIRYPDCYGIDMSRMKDFIAFRAALELHADRGTEHIIQEVYKECKELESIQELHTKNVVKKFYKAFSAADISAKIAELITPGDIEIPVEVIYQTIEDLHDCCPTNTGDWYFTGDYPTPGGNRVVNRAFINFVEGSNARAY